MNPIQLVNIIRWGLGFRKVVTHLALQHADQQSLDSLGIVRVADGKTEYGVKRMVSLGQDEVAIVVKRVDLDG